MDEFALTTASKKRKAVNTKQSPAVKRSRTDAAEEDDDITILASVEAMLAVPTNFIFREVVSGKSKRPLLSRSEAQCLLRVNLLASSMDSLSEISTVSLHQSLQCKSFGASLRATDNLHLRSLLVMLHMLGTTVSDSSLSFVKTELAKITCELQSIAASLRQCSDQNFSLAETLQDYAVELSEEKRKLSDIQEEICRRIDNLVGNTESIASTVTRPMIPMIPMNAYCQRIHGDSDDTIRDQEAAEVSPTVAAAVRKDENEGRSNAQSDAHSNDSANREFLEDSSTAIACSAVMTPPGSPDGPQLSEPEEEIDDDEANNTTTVAGTPTEPANTFQPHRLLASSASRSAVKHRTLPTSTAVFQPQRLLESSKETPAEGTEEKENAPSQSSSQHSSQHTPHSVLGAPPESESSPSCFQSQAAAEVLSSMAVTTRPVSVLQGEPQSPSEDQSPNS